MATRSDKDRDEAAATPGDLQVIDRVNPSFNFLSQKSFEGAPDMPQQDIRLAVASDSDVIG